MRESIILFGYGKFGRSIYEKLSELNYDVKVKVTIKENYKEARDRGIDVDMFNLYSDESIIECGIDEASYVVCAMDDNHENLFLALSIRELFNDAYIIAVSNSTYLTNKLKMAGVNRVIDMYHLSGLMIKNILLKPIASEFLQGFINNSHPYIFKEYKVTRKSKLVGKKIEHVDFDSFDIIFVGMVDLEKGKHFIFYSAGDEHRIDCEDTLILVGTEENIDKFILANGG